MAHMLSSRAVSTAINRPSLTRRASPALPRRAGVVTHFRPSDGRQDLIQSAGASKNKSKYVLPKKDLKKRQGKNGSINPEKRDFLTKSVTGEYDTAIFFLLVPALALLFLPVLSLALGQLHDAYPNVFGPFL